MAVCGKRVEGAWVEGHRPRCALLHELAPHRGPDRDALRLRFPPAREHANDSHHSSQSVSHVNLGMVVRGGI
jgi:hypothetical protein